MSKQKKEKTYELIERNHPAYEPIMFKVLQEALNSKASRRIDKGEISNWLNSLLVDI